MENKIQKAALGYLKKNISLVPVKNKIPLIKWEEFQNRRPTEEEVKEWFKKWPDANIAMVAGKISGLTVVDVEAQGDPKQFPATMTVKSGGGGWHFYYQYHEIKSINRILPYVDIKSDGGLITLPPSIHESGKEYEILSKRTATPFPAELFGEVQQRNGKDLSKLLSETIPQGDRNNSATSICGKLLLRFRQDEWESQAWPLFRAWNETHNEPPLNERELLNIFNSISQSEERRLASGSSVGDPILLESGERFTISVPITDGFAVFEFEDIEFSSRSIDTIVRCSVEIPATPSRKLVQRVNILSSSAKESLSRQLKESFHGAKIAWPLVLSQAFELVEKSFQKESQAEGFEEVGDVETQYLLKPFIEEGVPNILFGSGGSGKTYLSLKMAISLASGEEFLGLEVNKQVNTLFIDYENTKNIWASRIMKLTENRDYKDKLFYFNTRGIPLYDLKRKLLEEIKTHSIGLIIIDSAALACGGEPESAAVANRFFNTLDRLNTTSLIIAHETKNGGEKSKTPFGSIFFYNCARNIWNVEKSQEQGENVIQAGLFHRKSNNDCLSKSKAAKIEFGQKTVNILPGDNKYWTKELGLKTQILNELREGVNKLDDIVINLKKDRTNVRARLNELKTAGLVDSPSRGFWEVIEPKNDVI